MNVYIPNHIKLAVFDMAGTTVDEGGIVYMQLKESMHKEGIDVDEEQFNKWHGANKIEVIQHFVNTQMTNLTKEEKEEKTNRAFNDFLRGIETQYFNEASKISPMPGAIECFDNFRNSGIIVCLNTGYAKTICDHLVEKLGFKDHVEGWICAEEVGKGRPYPYMIHALMKRFNIEDVRQVMKCGDTARDMEEGKNAGAGVVIGVLTGADDEDTLRNAGADFVTPSVAHIQLAVAL